MERQPYRLIILGLLALIMAVACGLSSPPAISQAPGLVETLAAATWSVLQTSAYLSATPSQTPNPPTATPTVTSTPTITLTPTPTNTQIPPLTQQPTKTPAPTATITPIPTATIYYYGGGGSGGSGGGGGGGGSNVACLDAQIVQDMTIPDGMVIDPSVSFTKTWRIQNTGYCKWTSQISLEFLDGNRMGGGHVHVPDNVKPGKSIDVSVDMVSPDHDGTYTGYWVLVDRNDNTFGDEYKVRVKVISGASGEIFNFADKYCTAGWRSSSRSLPCPSPVGSRVGFVRKIGNPQVESGRVPGLGLWTQPPFTHNGWIFGQFPGLVVNSNDHFVADVGCMHGFNECKVVFSLFYKIGTSDQVQIGPSFPETYDGSLTHIELDLSGLAGQTVSFILYVQGQGNPDQNAAVWVDPQIFRP